MKFYYFLFLLIGLSFSGCNKETNQDDGCKKPDGIGVQDLGSQLRLSIFGQSDFYELEYGPNGFAKGSGTVVTCQSQHDLFNFTNGAYDFYVRGNCGGNEWSEWEGPKGHLVTNGNPVNNCLAPSNFIKQGDYLYWNTSSSSGVYEIEYGPVGFSHGSGVMATVSGSSYNDYSLAANNTYDFYIRTVCGVQERSDWVGPIIYYSANNYNYCPTPTNLSAYRSNSGGIAFVNYSFNTTGVSNFELRYGFVNNVNYPSNITLQISQNSGSFTQQGSAGAIYIWVRSKCFNPSNSDWAGPFYLN